MVYVTQKDRRSCGNDQRRNTEHHGAGRDGFHVFWENKYGTAKFHQDKSRRCAIVLKTQFDY